MDFKESCSSSSDDEDDDDDEESTGVDVSSDNILDELEVDGRKWECIPPHLPWKVAMHPRVKPSIYVINIDAH